MQPQNVIIGVEIAVIFAVLLGIVAVTRLASAEMRPFSDSYRGSWWILLAAYIVPLLFFTTRDPSALFRQGLSTYNIVMVIAAFAVGARVCWLIVQGRLPLRQFATGPRIWVLMLIGLYALSSIQSPLPSATLYQSLEILVFYALAAHVFHRAEALELAYRFTGVFLGFLYAWYAPIAVSEIAEGSLYGFMKQNRYALVSAAFLILHAWLRPRTTPGYVFGLYGLAGFGSAITLAAVLIAFAALTASRTQGSFRVLGAMAVVVGCSLFFTFLFAPETFPWLISALAALLQKDFESFATLTGRLPIWEIFFNYAIERPFGGGFWAAVRAFSANSEVVLPWQAGHAHNALLNAWVGAGFAGLAAAALVLFHTGLRTRIFVPPERGVFTALWLLLALNSMTEGTYAGQNSFSHFILALLLHAPVLRAPPTATATDGVLVRHYARARL